MHGRGASAEEVATAISEASDLRQNSAVRDFGAISHPTHYGEIVSTILREDGDWLVISVIVKYF
jgi:hypothetical protein